jgi:hypothetical protein
MTEIYATNSLFTSKINPAKLFLVDLVYSVGRRKWADNLGHLLSRETGAIDLYRCLKYDSFMPNF